MTISIVLINYNVRFFIEQCLSSVKKAIESSAMLRDKAEVIVVDNASADGSMDFLPPLFPGFRFVGNSENTGFARACNQGLRLCRGEFILFLNPDTLLAEDSLETCIRAFGPHTGAVGVRMVDGSGRFLRESKRGFPGTAASFFRLTGMTNLFPKSAYFSAYYRGEINENEDHEVDILSGAFMLVRKSVLDNTGGFDERFFMYAEDIDLSWRIRQAGFQNLYLAKTSIIHFKGESTNRDARYAFHFHEAMELFRHKYFRHHSAFVGFLIRSAIRFRELKARFNGPSRRNTHSHPVRRFWLSGDAGSGAECRKKLLEKNFMPAESETDAELIIYCEGPQCSWKSIIQLIESAPVKQPHYFHGAGTHSLIGSAFSDARGEVIEI